MTQGEQQQGRDGAADLAFIRAWNGEGHDSFGDRWDTARYFFDAGAEFARPAVPPAVGGGDHSACVAVVQCGLHPNPPDDDENGGLHDDCCAQYLLVDVCPDAGAGR